MIVISLGRSYLPWLTFHLPDESTELFELEKNKSSIDCFVIHSELLNSQSSKLMSSSHVFVSKQVLVPMPVQLTDDDDDGVE